MAVTQVVLAIVIIAAMIAAAVKSVAGGSSGKTKIVATNAIIAAINSANTIIMPLKDRFRVHSEKLFVMYPLSIYSLH